MHLILPDAHESNAYVAQDLAAHAGRSERNLVKRHAVHLDGGWVFLLLKVDVSHVDTQQMSLQSSSSLLS